MLHGQVYVAIPVEFAYTWASVHSISAHVFYLCTCIGFYPQIMHLVVTGVQSFCILEDSMPNRVFSFSLDWADEPHSHCSQAVSSCFDFKTPPLPAVKKLVKVFKALVTSIFTAGVWIELRKYFSCQKF